MVKPVDIDLESHKSKAQKVQIQGFAECDPSLYPNKFDAFLRFNRIS